MFTCLLRELSLAPLAMRFAPSITRRLAALGGRREALTKQLSQGTPTPITTMELVQLTLREELTPMPLLTMELPSPTLPILSLQLSLAMLSDLTNGNKYVCKRPLVLMSRLIEHTTLRAWDFLAKMDECHNF